MADVIQVPGEDYRRWYRDEYFDLFVWHNTNNAITGFSLCYDKQDKERALTWFCDKGFAHHQVDSGEQLATKNRTPILISDGLFPYDDVAQRFRERSQDLDPLVAGFILQRLQEFREGRPAVDTKTIPGLTPSMTSRPSPLPSAEVPPTRLMDQSGGRLIALGLLLEFLGPSLLGAVAGTFSAWLALLLGMGFCGIGIALHAKTKGRRVGWCGLAIVPFLGPILYGLAVNFTRHPTAVGITVTMLTIIGAIAYTAIDNFHQFQKKTRQSEARVTLNQLYSAATAFKEKHETYALVDIMQLEYRVKGPARYSYWYAVNGIPTPVPGSSQATGSCDLTRPPTSVRPAASTTKFIAVAKGNIDDDATCDEWSITEARVLTNTVNDIKE